MKLKRFFSRKIVDPSESGSLSDLAFLLIIYFIVIAGFNINKGFLLDLPDRDRPRIVQKQDLMKINLDESGDLHMGLESITFGEMEEIITANLEEEPNMTFILTIDPDCPYQNVVDVIYTVRRLDVDNFSFKMGEKISGAGG